MVAEGGASLDGADSPPKRIAVWARRAERAAPWILLSIIPVLVLPVLLTKSMTADEYVHVAAGAFTLETGSFIPNWEQPPLVKLLAAWPLRWMGIVSGSADPDDSSEVKEAYRKFWFENRIDHDAILFRARLPMIPISMALGALIYLWARSLYGSRGGTISLAAYVFSPTILGHTGLVTTDVAGAAGFLLALRLFWGACQTPSAVRFLLMGGSMGLAVLCKFSGLLLVPVMIVFLIGSALRARFGSEEHKLEIHRYLPRGGAGRKASLRAVGIVLAAAFVITWAGYAFETAPLSRKARLPKNKKLAVLIYTNPALRKAYQFVGEKMPVPIPSFFRGLDRLRKHNRHGHHAFFLGERSKKGWLTYFPVAFILKTSLPLLLLLGIAGITWWTGKGKRPAAESLLLVAAVTYLLIAMTSGINIGVRHILVFYVVLFVLLGRLATLSLHRWKWMGIALGLLLGWHAVEAIRISPHYLAYFQPLTGGPSQGYRYLVDSNLDWGQDLQNLARDLEQRDSPEVWLAYFGSLDPSIYGIKYKPLPPDEEVEGWVVISASALQLGVVVKGGRVGSGDAFAWLRKHEPFDSVGHSILYYQIPVRK
ncbi:MAG: glycosyltransferase family 39 protein [Planctomycetota bacterium]|nr:glycosyltransferase family 39 protein [Planctomycetota bacterium]